MEEWKPPPPGDIKLNFDGSATGSPGQARVQQTYAPPEAEALTLLSGVKLLREQAAGTVYVEGDSYLVINWAKKGKPPWKLKHVFEEIQLILVERNVIWCKIPRSANSLADHLAKDGVSKREMLIGLQWPL
ncbi:hypothetical protein H6P81_020590 [Aristolochia fimbriata]|uniref:RNase H type-1 domain-containing protein n=1 Tax=Aristolochia fimbriata TaxID=158543 RepID=A0AAV7DWM7_ARIFI|nr:hypothetical protein H6P81_020590 [Aristolochia fimbriata]